MPTFLHAGCGVKRKDQTTAVFRRPEWTEIRFDINPDVRPDITGTLTDMSAVQSGAVDAVFSSHNIEHLYPHEVAPALGEFHRVLRADGYALVTCPDLQSVAAVVARGQLEEPLYQSKAGPIAPLDILYGHRAAIERGEVHMAHRNGFTLRSLMQALKQAGFAEVGGVRRESTFELWVVGSKSSRGADEMRRQLEAHLPPAPS